MKKIIFIFTGIVLLIACQIKEMEGVSNDTVDKGVSTFRAVVECASTKVFVDENLDVLWNEDDRISIFNRSTLNEEYLFSGIDGDKIGTFERLTNAAAGETSFPHIYAVYPYSEETSINRDATISLNLTTKQLYAENSFGAGANIMIAVSEDNDLYFKNVGGYLCVQLYGNNVAVKSLAFKGNNGEKIAGAASINVGLNESPTVVMGETAIGEIGIECPSPVVLNSSLSTDFWFVLPPITFSEGFTITVTDVFGKTFEKETTNEVKITRNTRTRMSPVLVEMEPTVPPNNTIYYRTLTGEKIHFLTPAPFNVGIVSHTYDNGFGVIQCDGDVTSIADVAFANSPLTDILLPDCVEQIGSAFARTHLTSFRVPKNLSRISGSAFQKSEITRFWGPHTSLDGKCIIIDNTLMTYVNKGDADYTTPEGCTAIYSSAFFMNETLKNINVSEGVTEIGDSAFEMCSELKTVSLPASLEKVGYTPFLRCPNLIGFYGESKFCSDDHLFCIAPVGGYQVPLPGPIVVSIAHQQRRDIVVPDGIYGLENYCMLDDPYLERLYLPDSIQELLGQSVGGNCPNFKEIYGNLASEDHRCVIKDGTLVLLAGGGIKDYVTPKGLTTIGPDVFRGNNTIERIEISEGVKAISHNCFRECSSLQSIIIPSTVTLIESNIVADTPKLETIFCKALVPPSLRYNAPDFRTLRVYVPETSVYLYTRDPLWNKYFGPWITGYQFDGLSAADYYVSSDFSKDGEVVALQTASKGKGIDVVFLGDAFSDKAVANGSYASIMNKALSAFFSEEPFKSFRECFNIYCVVAVSATDGYEHGGQALGTYLGTPNSVAVGGDNDIVHTYMSRAISEDRMKEALAVVIMNSDLIKGTTHMERTAVGNYGNGAAIAYFTLHKDEDSFKNVLVHEANGHGFAKLADEYYYEGTSPTSFDIAGYSLDHKNGWWMNLDFTDDPEEILWSRFLKDNRYANQVGIYEGALFEHGAYRPSENSIMRNNTGGFNAPSRYAIWYRINKLAYGDEWDGSYEDFVAYDAINRTELNASAGIKRNNFVEKQMPPLAPPVVIDHSWRDR